MKLKVRSKSPNGVHSRTLELISTASFPLTIPLTLYFLLFALNFYVYVFVALNFSLPESMGEREV